jgi:hypothetical protein
MAAGVVANTGLAAGCGDRFESLSCWTHNSGKGKLPNEGCSKPMLHNNLHSFYVLFYATDGVSSGECLGSWEVSLDLKLASYSRLNEKVKRHEIESGERRTSVVNLKADTSDRPFSYLTIND